MSDRFAVLIGVDAYASSNALRAPGNDVVSWARLLDRLGFVSANVLVCASPAPAGLPDAANVVEADTDGVETALTWLVTRLAATPGAEGFVFFAGHGDLRARAWSSLYLVDYAGTPSAGDPEHFATSGILHLENLRRRVEAEAPGASLVAVVDTCRAPVDPEQETDIVLPLPLTWAQDNLVLVTAARPGEESYERCFDGVWRGQLTWALTTLLDQWSVQTAEDGCAYIDASFVEITERAARMIAAVSRSDQPQEPQVYSTIAGQRSPWFHQFGGGQGYTTAEPDIAGIHEWDAGNCGIIADQTGTLIGWFSVDAGNYLNLFFQAAAAPGNGALLRFTITASIAPTGVNSVYRGAAGAWSTLSTAPSTAMAVSGDGTLGLNINGAVWSFYYWSSNPQATSLPPIVNVDHAGQLAAAGTTSTVGKTLRTTADTMLQQVTPWGPGKVGTIKNAGGTLIGWFSTNGAGLLQLQFNVSPAPTGTANLTFETAASISPSGVQLTLTAPLRAWAPGSAAGLTVAANANPGSQGLLVTGAAATPTWTWYHVATTSAAPYFPATVGLPVDAQMATPGGGQTLYVYSAAFTQV